MAVKKESSKKKVVSGKICVLVVEDDQFLAGIYATKFNLEGFEVVLATDGATGLKLARKKRPDLILLDILMSKMDGFEVLSTLKRDPATSKIPVVLLSNLGQKEDVSRGLELGAADYLIKAHFVPAETVEKIKKILRIV